MIIARAIVRDLHSGVEEARMLSLLMLVFSVSPLFAPLVGNGVLAVASWRGVFWVVTALALAGIGLAAAFVPETHRPQQRGDGGFGGVLAACGRLLSDREYVGLTLLSAFAMSGFFIFLANSPFVLASHYGLSPLEYSVAFSVNAAAFFVAAQFNGKLGARFGLRPLITPALAGYATVLVGLVALTAAHVDHLAVVMGLLFVAYGFLGVILPVASVLALAEHGEIAGTASSLMSAIQLGFGSLMIAVSGKLNDGTITVFVGSIAACGVAALVLGAVSLRPHRGRPEPAV